MSYQNSIQTCSSVKFLSLFYSFLHRTFHSKDQTRTNLQYIAFFTALKKAFQAPSIFLCSLYQSSTHLLAQCNQILNGPYTLHIVFPKKSRNNVKCRSFIAGLSYAGLEGIAPLSFSFMFAITEIYQRIKKKKKKKHWSSYIIILYGIIFCDFKWSDHRVLLYT